MTSKMSKLRIWSRDSLLLSGVLGAGLLTTLGTFSGNLLPSLAAFQATRQPDTPTPAVLDAASFPSLQAALDALPESGGVVRIPPGIYRLEKPLVLTRANTRLEGAGPSTLLVNSCAEGEPSLVIRPPDLDKNPRAQLWRVEITALRIQGDPAAEEAKSSQARSGHGIWAQNINEIFIHGVTVHHHGGHGVYLQNCSENPRVIGCNITYNRGSGIHIDAGHDIVVSANQLEENGTALRCADGFNLCMTGNNIDDHLGDGVVIENTYGSVVSGNMIEECQGTAIVLARDCYGITVSANVIAHNFGGGIRVLDAWGCAISANTFVLNGKDSIYIGPESGRLALTGNSFCDSFIGQGTRRPEKDNFAGGIRLEGTSDITITGNQFSGLDGPAIIADLACRRIVITSNLMTDVNRRATEPRRPLEIPEIPELVLQHNITPGQ